MNEFPRFHAMADAPTRGKNAASRCGIRFSQIVGEIREHSPHRPLSVNRFAGAGELSTGPEFSLIHPRRAIFGCNRKCVACAFTRAPRQPLHARARARARARGTDLARSLIAINHCQNSATHRTTRAAGYHQQSRVLRDQWDKGRHGDGRGTGRDMEPVRYFRKLGPTALAFSANRVSDKSIYMRT